MRKLAWAAVLGGAAAIPAFAADHVDSPTAAGEPTADIADLYAWMNDDASKLNLVMTLNPFAGTESFFSPATQYVFHVNSGTEFRGTATETQVICQFYTEDRIECWAGTEYVEGDPSNPNGLTNENGSIRVFAGLRDDPFFFEFAGFDLAVARAAAAAEDAETDQDGCPTLSESDREAILSQLRRPPTGSGGTGTGGTGGSGTGGAMGGLGGLGGLGGSVTTQLQEGTDTFAGSNVLALVIQIDTNVVNPGGDILGVWASTHAAQ